MNEEIISDTKIILDGSSLPIFKDYLKEKNDYIEVLSSIKVLYDGLRNFEKNQHSFLKIEDAINFFEILEKTKTTITNTLKIGKIGVNLLTVHSSKGLEYEHVIILNSNEELWKKSGGNKLIQAPLNIQFYQDKDNDEDYLRLYFVALTRAKKNVLVTYPANSLSGKKYSKLSYLTEIQTHETSFSKPLTNSEENTNQNQAFSFHPNIENALKIKHKLRLNKEELLASRLENYLLSVTHVNNFLNIANIDDEHRSGPLFFRDTNLLNFPTLKPDSARYGTAIHETISFFVQNVLPGLKNNNSDKTLQISSLLEIYKLKLEKQKLSKESVKKYLLKGQNSLTNYWNRSDYDLDKYIYQFEFSFSKQDVYTANAHLTGNIDLLKTNKVTGEIEIIDFKTGKTIDSFTKVTGISKKIKALSYLRQLQFYKILLKNSKSFHDKINKVKIGTLEFIDAEPNEEYKLNYDLESFETNNLELLLQKTWTKIMNLDFIDTNTIYPNKFESIEQFCNDLLEGMI